jgi:hypothetical protein
MTLKRIPEHPSQELLDALRKCKLIGIHGPTNSGKSSLAKELVSLIGGTHINVDEIPGPIEGGKYLDHINFQTLKGKIQNCNKLPVIIDCYMLLDVLKIIDVQVDETLLCERANDENCFFDLDLESDFNSYQKRHCPRTSAKQIFKLFIIN